MRDVLGSRNHRDCYLHGCPCGYFGDPRRACTCAPGVLVATRSDSQLGAKRNGLINLQQLSRLRSRKRRGSLTRDRRRGSTVDPLPVSGPTPALEPTARHGTLRGRGQRATHPARAVVRGRREGEARGTPSSGARIGGVSRDGAHDRQAGQAGWFGCTHGITREGWLCTRGLFAVPARSEGRRAVSVYRLTAAVADEDGDRAAEFRQPST
jgi:hypothetical protein